MLAYKAFPFHLLFSHELLPHGLYLHFSGLPHDAVVYLSAQLTFPVVVTPTQKTAHFPPLLLLKQFVGVPLPLGAAMGTTSQAPKLPPPHSLPCRFTV